MTILFSPELIRRYGATAGTVANLARHRAKLANGEFAMPAKWVAEWVGISERSAVSAIQKLQADGFLLHKSGGGSSGIEKKYELA